MRSIDIRYLYTLSVMKNIYELQGRTYAKRFHFTILHDINYIMIAYSDNLYGRQ